MTQSLRFARILGAGSYVPAQVITNDDMCTYMDTSDEWITKRTGVKERRFALPEESTSDLAIQSSYEALENAKVKKEELDMIIVATSTPDHEGPPTGCFLQAKMGLRNIPAWDVRMACCGFVYSLCVANQFVRTGFCDKILLVASEVQTKSIEHYEYVKELAVLLGDGSGAVVLGACDEPVGFEDPHIFSTHIHADGEGAKSLWCPAPGSNTPGPRISHERIDRLEHLPIMDGPTTFLHAVQMMPEAVREGLNANNLKADDIDMFFFHQANLRINDMVAKVLGVPQEKVYNTIQRYGNTTAATIPLGLGDAVKEGKLKKGMLIMTTAFGAGYAWGTAVIRW